MNMIHKLMPLLSLIVIILTVLQIVQCAAIYPEKDWPSNEGSDMEGNVNLLNAMTKRSFCPRAFTWNPSLRTCLPTLAALRSRMGRRSRY